MQKTTHVFPIIGGRKVEHLHANIAALDIALTAEHIVKIEAASPFFKGTMYAIFVCHVCQLGWTFLLTDDVMKGDGSDYGTFHRYAGHFDRWPLAPPLRPISN